MVDQHRLIDLVEPIVTEADADLYDLIRESGSVRVLVDRPSGIDLDAVAELSRAISAVLDDTDAIAGAYTLEVSSPGLERPLRTAEHFAGAVGEIVSVRLKHKIEGTRRVKGTLVELDDEENVVVEPDDGNPTRTFPLDAVQKAHTVFVWDRSSSDRKART